MKKLPRHLDELHKRTVVEGHDFYLDPGTGRQVMTEQYLWARGWCCRSGCRHCPYRSEE